MAKGGPDLSRFVTLLEEALALDQRGVVGRSADGVPARQLSQVVKLSDGATYRFILADGVCVDLSRQALEDASQSPEACMQAINRFADSARAQRGAVERMRVKASARELRQQALADLAKESRMAMTPASRDLWLQQMRGDWDYPERLITLPKLSSKPIQDVVAYGDGPITIGTITSSGTITSGTWNAGGVTAQAKVPAPAPATRPAAAKATPLLESPATRNFFPEPEGA